MARAIDADALYDLVERRYQVSSGIEHRCERDLLDLICNMPTLTPPSEPLRCTGCMYLDADSAPCVHCIRAAGYADYYRRPPEGIQ